MWCDWHSHHDAGKVDAGTDVIPLIVVHNAEVFAATVRLLSGAGAEEFAGRYTGRCLRLKSDEDVGFRAFSFHGRKNGKGANEAWRKRHCRDFIKRVGEETVLTGLPAVIGGDWNVVFKAAPQDETGRWSAQLQAVQVFGPPPKICRRQLTGKPAIDYFCIVRPFSALPQRGRSTPLAAQINSTCVTARPHKLHVESFDHDPLFMQYSLAAPAGAGAGAVVVRDGDSDAEPESADSLARRVRSWRRSAYINIILLASDASSLICRWTTWR